MKLAALSPAQELLRQQYCDAALKAATSTEPANRPKAEAAARRLAKLAGMRVHEVLWAASPEEGKAVYEREEKEFLDSLRTSLRDSLEDSPWGTGWVTFYRFCGELAEYKPEDREKLDLYQQLLESCSAMWLLPGRVILCERPSHVEIEAGKVRSMRWER